MNYSKATIREHADIFKAMSHPSRILIIRELSKGRKCVGELTDLVGSDTSTVSRHLMVLRNAGLIRDDKIGLQVFYELRCKCVLKFLDCVESISAERSQTACNW